MIEVFTSKTCVQCPLVKDYLDKLGVEYIESDVMVGDNMARLQKMTGLMTVPVTISGTEVVTGFNRMKLAPLIRKQTSAFQVRQGASL